MSLSDSDGLLVLLQLGNRQIIHAAASATFLFYDLVTTLDDEVEYVWSSANAFPKYLYFVSRYLGLFGQLVLAMNLAPMFCFSYLMFCFGFLFLLLMSVELSLIIRVDALYGKSRTVRLLLGAAFTTELVGTMVLNGVSFSTVYRTLDPFPSVLPVKGCLIGVSPPTYKLSWIPILAFETLLFALNAINAYYVISVICMLVCTVAQFFEGSLATIAVVWVSAVLSYSGCHLLLSIRKTAARRQRLETNMLSIAIPHIHVLGETTSESESPSQFLNDPHPLRLELGTDARPRPRPFIESIELVQRRVLSLPLSAEDSPHASESDWVERCMRDWDVVDGGTGEDLWGANAGGRDTDGDGDGIVNGDVDVERVHKSDDLNGVRWLHRWKP